MDEFFRLPYPMSGFHALTRWVYGAHREGLSAPVMARYEETRAQFDAEDARLARALLRNERDWLALAAAHGDPVEHWLERLAHEGLTDEVDADYRQLVRLLHLRQLYFPDTGVPGELERVHRAYLEARGEAHTPADPDTQALFTLQYMHLHGPTPFLEHYGRHVEERIARWSDLVADGPAPRGLRPWQSELRRVCAGELHVGEWMEQACRSYPTEDDGLRMLELLARLERFFPDLSELSLAMSRHIEHKRHRHLYLDVHVAHRADVALFRSYIERGKGAVIYAESAKRESWEATHARLAGLSTIDAPCHTEPMPETATTRYERKFDQWCRLNRIHVVYPWAKDDPPRRAEQIREHILLGARDELWPAYGEWLREQGHDATWIFLVDAAGCFDPGDCPPRQRMVVLAIPTATRLPPSRRPKARQKPSIPARQLADRLLKYHPFYLFDFPLPYGSGVSAYRTSDQSPATAPMRFWAMVEHAVATFAHDRSHKKDRMSVYVRDCDFVRRTAEEFEASQAEFIRRVDAAAYWDHLKVFTPQILPRDEHPHLPYAEAVARVFADSRRRPDDQLRHRLRRHEKTKGFRLRDVLAPNPAPRAEAPVRD
ncbi:hypothetical protein FIV42_00020 [Persicimonas caeni]|uniref:Uncharacterized protein n=1 Tax=Persicimonas caeni TaxID=2292766 RepID=A0A4Y6PLT7_PERCE|nr:hypothetical protein [Persicimonas caeni]QDG49179.1 hypothetical protein FIV42_00020 [Persicimonas caeni]QED30400.1 hypothetical protein FRD00_00015 [Persicimonas caeni]